MGFENFPRSVLGKAFYNFLSYLLNLFGERRQICIVFFISVHTLKMIRDHHHLPRGGAVHELQDKEELLHDAHPRRPGQSSLLLHQPGPQL